MFCPICKVEYRRGFTHCSDCDVDLVAALPADSTEDSADQNLQVVWEGSDQNSCVSACKRLQRAGIRYEVAQIPSAPYEKMRVDWNYKVGVLPSNHTKALEAIGPPPIVDIPDPDELDGPSPMELADDGLAVAPDSFKGDWDPQAWFPEDATAEVWSGGDHGHSGMIEMSFKENRIHFWVEPSDEKLKKYFVLPEDEARAREIIQEIVEGRPPT